MFLDLDSEPTQEPTSATLLKKASDTTQTSKQHQKEQESEEEAATQKLEQEQEQELPIVLKKEAAAPTTEITTLSEAPTQETKSYVLTMASIQPGLLESNILEEMQKMSTNQQQQHVPMKELSQVAPEASECQAVPIKVPEPISIDMSEENAWVALDDGVEETATIGNTAQLTSKEAYQNKSECHEQEQEKHEPAEPESHIVAVKVMDKEKNDVNQQYSTSSSAMEGASSSSVDWVETAQTIIESESVPLPVDTAWHDSAPSLPSWDVASEHVATVALQCLSRDKDMELSYVAILSAITVLQSKQDQSPLEEDQFDEQTNHYLQGARNKVARTYSQIMSIMCRSKVAEDLGKETLRQGVMSAEALYTQFYGSIQQAGYDLEDNAHISMAQYWMDHKKIEEAQECLGRVEPARWTGPAYRLAITCLLFSKPRHIQDAETLLQKYVDSKGSDEQRSVEEESKIRTWFKLQVDASKWEEVKAQYELRRTRLVYGPSNTERKEPATIEAESKLTPQALHQHQLQEQLASPRQSLHEYSKSVASSTTSSSHRRSPSSQYAGSQSGHRRTPSGHQRTPSVATSWPSGATAKLSVSAPAPTLAAPVAATKGAFSFLSSLKFTKTSETDAAAALPSRMNVNRHLIVLDNVMLEECITYGEFEYGWNHVYEKMGPALEDSDTAKIAMRLCTRAFLGHSGLDCNYPGALHIMARDIQFEDDQEETVALNHDSTSSTSCTSRQDSEIWEARAWAIYNKAMMSPHTFLSINSGSTTNSQPPSTAGNVGHVQPASGTTALSSSKSGTTTMSMFLHDILTIAIHSPELSSRYLKAFKIYSAIRSENQSQGHLRDPFVMSCMIKAIYDATLSVIHNPDQMPPVPENRRESIKHHRRSSSLSLNQSQPMTLGPLMDLAFEIYADMRNVGSIRHLPSLVILSPSSPVGKTYRKNSNSFSGMALPAMTAASNTSSASSTVDPSEIGTISTISISPRASFTALTMPVFQELNPSLKPNLQARRLPTELYLALLHLCIQMPVYRISSQVVKTIVADMTMESGRQLHRLDHHLAAALQCFHDTWMVCPRTESSNDGDDGVSKKCVYFEWMYQSEAYVQEQIEASRRLSAVSSASSTTSNHAAEEIHCEGADVDADDQEGEETCNDRLYWDLWSSEDMALKEIRFSTVKAKMLWKHVAQVLV
ncbi:hypothetical protein EDD11_004787 [Mortierella claussenii]|nr:hypothetical protein EDD11_004787 [Mortierella claussenii]